MVSCMRSNCDRPRRIVLSTAVPRLTTFRLVITQLGIILLGTLLLHQVAIAVPVTVGSTDPGSWRQEPLQDASSKEAEEARSDRLDSVHLPSRDDHDRQFHALEAARHLAESGVGYEAARVVAALARQSDSPPAHQANRQLEQWGLTIEQIQQWPIARINQQIMANRSGSEQRDSEFLHLQNLVDLQQWSAATGWLQQLGTESDGRQRLRGYLQQQGIQVTALDRPVSESQAAEWVKSLEQRRKDWRSLQRLWLEDHHSGELALRLWNHLGLGRTPTDPMFWEPHQPPLEELRDHAVEHIRVLFQRSPQSARFLSELVVRTGPDSRQAATLRRQWANWSGQDPILPTALDPKPLRHVIPEQLLGEELFGQSTIHHYRLELDPLSRHQLQQEPREYVTATFYEGETAYPNVGVRLKGGAGSFREFDGQSKIGLTIKFNQFEKGQRFHELRRIILNNAVQDASYLNEFLGYQLFRRAGIPAPRVTFATLKINDEPYGLYVQPEAITKDFLKAWFSDHRGNLYEGPGDVQNWEGLDLDTNQEENDRSDLRRLAAAIEVAPERDPWVTLSDEVDLANLARFVALEQVMGHWDGFSAINNYRMYHDPETDRFFMIPHGADQLFRDVNHPVFQDQASILGRALTQSETGKVIYRQALEEVLRHDWDEPTLRQQIADVYLRLMSLEFWDSGKGPHDREAMVRSVAQTLDFLELRRAMVRSQIEQESRTSWRQPRGHIGLPSFLRQH